MKESFGRPKEMFGLAWKIGWKIIQFFAWPFFIGLYIMGSHPHQVAIPVQDDKLDCFGLLREKLA